MILKYAPKREKKLIRMSEVEEPMAYIDNSNGYYITPSGNEIAKFGSISECHKAIGVSKSTITRYCKNQIKTKTRKGYYFRYQSV